MNRFHLFRALGPSKKYPTCPMNLSFKGVRYDLILPPRTGIEFARLLSPNGQYRLAELSLHIESADYGVPVGYILQQVIATPAEAKQILISAFDGETFPFDVVDWIVGHAPFLDYCGGFEVAHVCWYASDEERQTALDAAAGAFDDTEPDLYQLHVTHLNSCNSSPTEETYP
jgi:hypothetical protein